MSNLIETLFWATQHDEEAKKISKNANQFANEHLTSESIYQYLYWAINKVTELEKKCRM
jgi:hypothetical protein